MYNNCGAIAQETPVCKFHKKLTTEHALHKEGLEASQTKIEAWEIVRGYAICSLAKTEQTYEFYRDLINFELFDMKDSAEIIRVNIDEHVEKDTALGNSINQASKILNDLHVKLHDANNVACSMRNCLQNVLGFKDDKVPQELQCVTEPAKGLSKHGKKAADAMVKIAGIHTFSNLETLKPFGVNLSSKLSALEALVDELIETAEGDEKAGQTHLLGVLKELNKEEFSSFHSNAIVNAEKSTIDFICEGECEPIECVEIICKTLGNCDPDTEIRPGKYLQDDQD